MSWLSAQLDKELDAALAGRTKPAARLAVFLLWAVIAGADVTNRHSGLGRALLALVSVMAFIAAALYAAVLLRVRSMRRGRSET